VDGVIPELREDPGAEDRAESWETAKDLGVRVSLKTRSELVRERLDLRRHLLDDPLGCTVVKMPPRATPPPLVQG